MENPPRVLSCQRDCRQTEKQHRQGHNLDPKPNGTRGMWGGSWGKPAVKQTSAESTVRQEKSIAD